MVGLTRIGQFGVFGMVLLMTIAACGGAATETTEAGGDQPDPTTAPVATTVPAATTTTIPAATTTMAPATTTTTTTVEASTGGLQIIQVGLDTSFQEGWVLLQNTGNTPWSLTGHYLCQRPNYFALPDVTIPAGDIYWIGVGAAIDAPGVGANGAVGSFDPDGGEVGLYSSNSFGDANAILSYVEWGSTGHGRSSVAVAAGIWSTGDFVPVLGSLTGAIIVIDAAARAGAANWEELEAP